MEALCLVGAGEVVLRTVPIPAPLPGDAVIKIMRVGVCNTDLEMAKGYGQSHKGMILGHEFVGKVESINNNSKDVDSSIEVGDRVVGEINLVCDKCKICSEIGGVRKRNHCPNRTVLGIINKNGTFAEFITLPVNNLFKVPDEISDEQAVFTEPLAAAFRIKEQIDLSKEQLKIAVIGDGKLGLLITQVIARESEMNEIVLFGHHMDKMDLISARNVDKVISNDKTTEEYENKFDICIDACGTQAGIKLAVKITRPMGTVILKTTCADEKFIFNPFEVVVKEQILIGSRCGNFKMALDALVGDNKVNVENLVCGVYPRNQAVEAFRKACELGALKVQIVMDG